jgi:hypothetical protein
LAFPYRIGSDASIRLNGEIDFSQIAHLAQAGVFGATDLTHFNK